jgi:uncharacterized delta-60 repeat protein
MRHATTLDGLEVLKLVVLALGTALGAALGSALSTAPVFAADGLDDPGGYASYPFDLNSAATDLAYGCAAQADGKVLLAGSATSTDEGLKIAVARLQLNGLADTSFGGGTGEVVVTLAGQVPGHSGQARAIAVDAQSRILVGGTLHETAFFNRDIGFVTRLLANGAIDTGWDNGYFAGWFVDGGMSRVTAMGFDPAGRLWTTGPTSADGTGPWRFQVMGDFGNDAGYGSIDIAPLVTDFLTTAPTAIAFQPDGNVLIGGWVQRGAPSFLASMVVVRIQGANLLPDPGFGFLGNGVVVIDDFESIYLRSIALTPDLEIVVAGESGPLNAEDIVVIGLRPGGTVRWGDYLSFDLGGSNGDGIGGLSRMVVQSDGKIVVAAVSYTGDANNIVDVAVGRVLPMIAGWDTTFGGNGTGKRSFDMPPVGNGNGNDTLTCLTLAAGKAVLVGSGHYSGSDWDFSFRRLTNDLIFADSFESATTFFWSRATP